MAIRIICADLNVDAVFAQDLITLGRAPGNVVQLNHAQVSKVHGQLVYREGQYHYQDLGSTNGSMVCNDDGELVCDRESRELFPIGQRARLQLGDRRAPVIVELHVTRDAPRSHTKTVIASRAFHDFPKTVAAFFDHGQGQARLQLLLELMEKLQRGMDANAIADLLVNTLFDTLPGAALAGFFFETDRGILPLLLRTRARAEPLAIPWHRVEPLLRQAIDAGAALQIEDEKAVATRFEQAAPGLRVALACPFWDGAVVRGMLTVAGSKPFPAADLDWLSLLAWHCGLAIRNVLLLKKLEKWNQQLENENVFLKNTSPRKVQLVGQSEVLKRVLRQVEIVARTDTTVLILGETGTGKELIARMVHEQSPRASRLFAAINCGALAETLLESELFGHVKGAFTGATTDKRGLLEVADGGTLMLDEFGEMSPQLQVKLLRVLENGEITPVGGIRTKRIDVRIVAATNKDLKAEVDAGRVREDLYYRINVFPVQLPPLRERQGDVRLLANHFLSTFAERFSKSFKGFSAEALQRIDSYAWPGNVRELQNEVERAALLAPDGSAIQLEDLSERIGGLVELPVSIGPLHEAMEKVEEQYLRKALMAHDYNRTRTAATLGISRQALTAKLHKFDLFDLKGGDS
ncbi:MAG: sigma 54-interacting transcriptional regulator [Myxococcota bacterium]|nr:sigma 54-interacting transcriptional regulator [Myxococcota bacterium]